jgi:Skp family chaperone for outer membrane proteins
MEENSVDLLLDSKNIFMGARKLDLTEDILKKINKEFK